MSERRRVAVLFGGRSLEHDVSVVSGLQILHALDPDPLCADAGLHRSAAPLVDRRRSVAPRGVCKGGGPDRSRADRGDAVARLRHVDARCRSGDGVAGASRRTSRSTCSCRCCTARSARTAAIQGLLELGGCAYVGCGVRRVGGRHEQAAHEGGRAADGRAGRALDLVRARRARSRLALAARPAGRGRPRRSAGR